VQEEGAMRRKLLLHRRKPPLVRGADSMVRISIG
jgi:hypothetical protein